MAGPSITFAAPRQRTRSITSVFGGDRIVSDPLPVSKPDASPKQNRRGTRETIAFFFARPERHPITTDTSPNADSSSLDATADAPVRSISRSRRPSALLSRSLTSKGRPLSRVEPSPTLPSIFASLPGRTRDSLRNSYEAPRRSFERAESFTLSEISPDPLDVPEPETPTPNPHTFRTSDLSAHSESITSHTHRSMSSFARPAVRSSHTMRRISALPLGGVDDVFDSEPGVYRASTADLSEFLRDTGPEDARRRVPVEKGSIAKEVDRDGTNSVRSRTKSSIFRLGGRKREKSRPTISSGTGSNDPIPQVPVLAGPGLPALHARDEGAEVRTSFSQMLPMLGLNEESANLPAARASTPASPIVPLPPNTREHRLPDGTTILMITTPQSSLEPKLLPYSRSLGLMGTVVKNDLSRPSLAGSSSSVTVKPADPPKSPTRPLAHPATTKLKTHSPTVSISSDGTLSTTERPGEDTAPLVHNRHESPLAQGAFRTVDTHTSLLNLQDRYLQVHTPKSRPRGYSSPDPVSPPSAKSTPTVATPTPTSFSPSASIAPTPELTPQKHEVRLPMVKIDLAPRKGSEPIVVDGLRFPTPPEASLPSRRRPNTLHGPHTSNVATDVSPSRSSKSMRVVRSPRKSNPTEEDLPKERTRRNELGVRPRPLNLDVVPSYRDWKTNAPEVQTQPGELTGLELDLNEGTPELEKKRNSLMEQHQQMFLSVNPFQTPPSPADPFLGPSMKNGVVGGATILPLVGGPPAMPLPPSPHALPAPPIPVPHSPISPSSALPTSDIHRLSVTPRRRSRVDSFMAHSSVLFHSSPVSIAAPLPPSDTMLALTSALSAQREQFDGMSRQLIDVVKSFEEEKKAFELRIQELSAAVAEKDAKAKEDERKIQGLEWLVGNLNLRACAGKGSNGNEVSDSDAEALKLRRRRSSFAGLGANEDTPLTPLPIEHALNATERAKRTASMDDVFRNLVALSETGARAGALGLNTVLTPPNIYEWAANTVLEQD